MAASSSSAADILLQEEFAKIRPHVSSTLANQKTPALLLGAIEETLREQDANLKPVAYFAAIISTLEQTIQKEQALGRLSLGEGDVLPALLYLLAIVVPRAPSSILRSQAQSVMSVLGPLIAQVSSSAPPLRSILSVFMAWMPALESTQLTIAVVRQSFAAVVQFTLDPRPKVRKKAQDVVQAVISAPPPPSLKHPYADDVADYIVLQLDDIANRSGPSRLKGHKGEAAKSNAGLESGMWCCAYVKGIASFWPATRIVDLVNALLRLPSLGSSYLTTNAYDLLAALLAQSTFQSSFETGKIPSILSVVLSSQPAPNDQLLAMAWLHVVEHGMVAYARDDPDRCASELARVWDVCWKWLASTQGTVMSAACEALCSISRYCITLKKVEEALDVAHDKLALQRTTLGGMIALNLASLSALGYASAVPHILRVTVALLSRLRMRRTQAGTGRGPPAAQILMMQTVKTVGALRTKKGFEHRERADDVLGMAIEVVGPETVLDMLPLNLEPNRPAADEGRAYLLPLLRARITNTRLSHFVTYFVPLSERLFNLQSKAEEEGRPVEQKIYNALVEQIWACFPAYCDMPVDLKEAFTPGFAQLLTQVLYSQPAMRTFVLRGLQRLVETNTSLAASMAPSGELSNNFGIDQTDASSNVEFLRGIAGNLVSVFFNVFGSVARDARGFVGDVISTYLTIADVKLLASVYEKVLNLLKEDMKKGSSVGPTSQSGSSVTHTMLDLLILFVPHLPPKQAKSLFALAMTPDVLESKDAAVQKKGYRVLARLLRAGKIFQDDPGIDALVTSLMENPSLVSSAAKRDRISLFGAIVPALPSTQLHLITTLLPEAVLGTKEVNEGTRNEAFLLLVNMAQRMSQGGTISRSLVSGMDDGTDVPASLQEFMTMVAAGLAGSTPHMISASITALSRLVFDFKDVISVDMQSELVSTIAVYVGSTNREIVKSALGFIKVVVVVLQPDVIRPHLSVIVPSLLNWSHDHKNHFKGKVRHIFERLIRKFGFEAVHKEADEDHRKLIVNIKKRKDRAKRKKANAEADEKDESAQEEETGRVTHDNAFEDVLYGSESELGDDSDDQQGVRTAAFRAGRKAGKSQTLLRVDDDEPMDLLEDATTRMMTSKSVRHRKPGEDAASFKVDDSGKMIIDDEEEEEGPVALPEDMAGTAYRESLTSADGFTRGRRGEVKFNKNTKKRRLAEDEDIEMADADREVGQTKKKIRQRAIPMTQGQEYKARKAQGDTRRVGQQEPYAYLSLAQTGVKKNGKPGFSTKTKR